MKIPPMTAWSGMTRGDSASSSSAGGFRWNMPRSALTMGGAISNYLLAISKGKFWGAPYRVQPHNTPNKWYKLAAPRKGFYLATFFSI